MKKQGVRLLVVTITLERVEMQTCDLKLISLSYKARLLLKFRPIAHEAQRDDFGQCFTFPYVLVIWSVILEEHITTCNVM